jgi:hypothetical protein
MAHWLHSWFGWPDGGVWSNIAASLIWSGIVWVPTIRHLHRKIDRQHNEIVREHRKLHRHLGVTDSEETP